MADIPFNSPTDAKLELAAVVAKGLVSALVPYVGGIVAEVGNLYLNPLEKRKQAWTIKVCRAIEEIQGRFSRLPASLEADDAFVSFLYQTTIVAMKNHQREKLQALANALVSAADPEGPAEDTVFQFIRYIDELSATHLRILAGLDQHSSEFAQLEQLDDIYVRFQALTALRCDRTTFRAFVQDLETRFLFRIGDVEDFPEYASKVSPLTLEGSVRAVEVTDLGRSFLTFLSQSVP